MRNDQWLDGRRNGVKFAVEWLHKWAEGNERAPKNAKVIANILANGIGTEFMLKEKAEARRTETTDQCQLQEANRE